MSKLYRDETDNKIMMTQNVKDNLDLLKNELGLEPNIDLIDILDIILIKSDRYKELWDIISTSDPATRSIKQSLLAEAYYDDKKIVVVTEDGLHIPPYEMSIDDLEDWRTTKSALINENIMKEHIENGRYEQAVIYYVHSHQKVIAQYIDRRLSINQQLVTEMLFDNENYYHSYIYQKLAQDLKVKKDDLLNDPNQFVIDSFLNERILIPFKPFANKYL